MQPSDLCAQFVGEVGVGVEGRANVRSRFLRKYPSGGGAFIRSGLGGTTGWHCGGVAAHPDNRSRPDRASIAQPLELSLVACTGLVRLGDVSLEVLDLLFISRDLLLEPWDLPGLVLPMYDGQPSPHEHGKDSDRSTELQPLPYRQPGEAGDDHLAAQPEPSSSVPPASVDAPQLPADITEVVPIELPAEPAVSAVTVIVSPAPAAAPTVGCATVPVP